MQSSLLVVVVLTKESVAFSASIIYFGCLVPYIQQGGQGLQERYDYEFYGIQWLGEVSFERINTTQESQNIFKIGIIRNLYL